MGHIDDRQAPHAECQPLVGQAAFVIGAPMHGNLGHGVKQGRIRRLTVTKGDYAVDAAHLGAAQPDGGLD